MQSITVKLTATIVDNAKVGATEYFLWDENTKGFGVRVRPTGVKSWIVQYRVGKGREAQQRRVTIGKVSSLKLSAAKLRASQYLGKAAFAEDMVEEIAEERRSELSVNDAIDMWVKEAAPMNRRTGAPRTPANIKVDVDRLEIHVRPVLGTKRLSRVTKADIEVLRDTIASGRTASKKKTKARGVRNAQGGAGTAARAIRVLSSVFAHAEDHELISMNSPIVTAQTKVCRVLAVIGFMFAPHQVAASEPSFRVRSDVQAALNADSGWAGAQNELVLQPADEPFRLRLEAEPPGSDPVTFQLQVRRNGKSWETLEAQGFPKAEREIVLTFKNQSPGTRPSGWTIRRGSPEDMSIVARNPDPVLHVNGGPDGLMALYPTPWPLTEFTFAAEFRFDAEDQQGFGMLFGFVDDNNYGRVQVEPRLIRVSRMQQGRETIIGERPVLIEADRWHALEIQMEGETLEINFDDDALEFEVAMGSDMPSREVGIAAALFDQAEIRELVIEGEPRTPPVSIVETTAYSNTAATADILAGSSAPFVPGFGVSLADKTPHWEAEGGHGEFEWPLVIRRFADGALTNESGDRFEFRMVDTAGVPVAGASVAQIGLTIPAGHLGGTFVETPGRIGPWQASNGDLYFIMEPSETDNRFMMMKSADGGQTWSEVDGDNRPETGDLESVDSRQVRDAIHIIHQVTHSVRYHSFNTSDHPTQPDQWVVRDEIAARATAIAQMATLVVRPDGSMVTVFLADRLRMAIRSAEGQWGPQVEIDPGDVDGNAGPQAILGADGVIHLAYLRTDGSVWHRRVGADGALGPRQQIAEGTGTRRAEYGAVLPLVYDPASDTVIIVYRLEDGYLWERRVRSNAAPSEAAKISDRPVITNAVDAQQPAADVVLDGDILHVLFVDENTRQIFSTHDRGGWQTPVLRVDGIRGSWVRGNVVEKTDGRRAYGYIYDAGSEGGSGLNRLAEIILSSYD